MVMFGQSIYLEKLAIMAVMADGGQTVLARFLVVAIMDAGFRGVLALAYERYLCRVLAVLLHL